MRGGRRSKMGPMRDMISSAVAGGILALLALLLGSLPTGDSRPWVDAVAWVSGDPVPGCDAVYEAGGVRAAVCQPDRETTEIRILGGDGTSRLLATHSVSDGFWREALPSPDGRWVLAQWSGPCEIPVA